MEVGDFIQRRMGRSPRNWPGNGSSSAIPVWQRGALFDAGPAPWRKPL